VGLEIFNKHGGPQLADEDEVDPGSFVLVNIDDDDGANGDDNTNDVVDGTTDKLDMAKMRLLVAPYDAAGLTITLKASNGAAVKVFDEEDGNVDLDEVLDIDRFANGAIDYHVEGVTPGACTFTLEVKQGGQLMWAPAPQVKVTVVDYHASANKWGAWPGGQEWTYLNPEERLTSTDLGLSGGVKWSVDSAGDGAQIISHFPVSGDKWTEIHVQYNETSDDNTFTKAVEIKAYDTGPDSKLAAVRRTVFTGTWRNVNISNTVDEKNALRFSGDSGTNTNQCEFNWDGERGASLCAAKIELGLDIEPQDIDWDARGVHFEHTGEANPSGNKWDCRFARWRRGQAVGQLQGWADRRIVNFYLAVPANDSDWTWDSPFAEESGAQYPKADVPNAGFTLDEPGFDPTGRLQGAQRMDMRESLDWYVPDMYLWHRVTPWRPWHANITAVLPNGTQDGANNHGGTGYADDIPNQQPVANAGDDQQVYFLDTVQLDGTGSSDADNDGLSYRWTQTDGPSVYMTGSYTATPEFTAPEEPCTLTFQLIVRDICEQLHFHRPDNYESNPDTVTVTVQGD